MTSITVQLVSTLAIRDGGPYFTTDVLPEVGDYIRHPRISGKVLNRTFMYTADESGSKPFLVRLEIG